MVKNIILPELVSWVIYDYKHEINHPGAEVFYSLSDFKKKPGQRGVIYRTKSGSDEEFDGLCRRVFSRGANTLILDEVADHCAATKIAPGHDLIMRLGRSKGVGIVNCTQRPRGLHNNIISQCEHFFIFDLIQDTDRKKLAEFCGEKVLERAKDYCFWYYHISMEEPVFCRPVKMKSPAAPPSNPPPPEKSKR